MVSPLPVELPPHPNKWISLPNPVNAELANWTEVDPTVFIWKALNLLPKSLVLLPLITILPYWTGIEF